MPAKYDGLLTGKLDKVSLHSRSKSWTSASVRHSRWSLEPIRPHFFNRRPSPSKKPMRPTAWLDGLRGFAAFIVYWHHHHLWAHDLENQNAIYENAFGFEGKHYFVSAPWIRNFFTGGHYAVSIFFVISGYVLSYKGLGLIQRGQHVEAADTVGSALFRRWLRLYIPVIAVTFLWMSQSHTIGIWSRYGKPKGSFREEIWNWYALFKNYSFVFLTGDVYAFPVEYHVHSWSIPFEFKGSIITYTALSAFSRCTRNARLWCELGLIYYFMYITDGWYGAMFMAGMFLCDLDLLSVSDNLPRFLYIFENFKELIFFHLFILSLYLGGVPSPDKDKDAYKRSPGWVWLSYLKPQAVYDDKWFYLFWAAVLLVASVPRLPWLKRFFETRFCQYLARISFALYLVHGPVLWILGDRLYAATGFVTDAHREHIPGWVDAFPLTKKGVVGFELAFLAPQIVLLPCTLWLAEIVTKLFDEQSVKISTWLYKKTLAPPAQMKA
ncbi:acyltransferas-like protein [Delitschia confertaspora ATCC 74209]|uniref:Acyltransferas-like protein n=1 Tax=Delitschia confertaspora ATCC 74209 TaxID=1513339 RepID=A0A9P4MUR7_9PLEO|nr:acyltransferas-like protein [Delitschia confertaspora ATCC 74209]